MQIARDWTEDMAAYTPQEVEQAVKWARRELDWFPSTKQMIELCARARGDMDRWQQRALPEPEVMEKPEISDATRDLIARTKAKLAARMTA